METTFEIPTPPEFVRVERWPTEIPLLVLVALCSAALCADRRGAARGLVILAAGGAHARQVDLDSFAGQRRDLNTGWMTLGQWLSTYPILSKRLVALNPELGGTVERSERGPLRALGILALAASVPLILAGVLAAKVAPVIREALRAERAPVHAKQSLPASEIGFARTVVESDFKALSDVLLEYRERHGHLPEDVVAVYDAWRVAKGAASRAPTDPFDGHRYFYSRWPGGFTLYSSGPDGESDTDDDISEAFAYAGDEP